MRRRYSSAKLFRPHRCSVDAYLSSFYPPFNLPRKKFPPPPLHSISLISSSTGPRKSTRVSQSLPDIGIESLKVIALDNFYVNNNIFSAKIPTNYSEFRHIFGNTLRKANNSLNVRLAK